MTIISSREIVLDNHQSFHYTIHPFELKNSLGKIIALLQEYEIISSNSILESSSYKLYKTKEGNWYEIESENSPDKIIRELKSAINSIESDFEKNILF
ncbi:MAG: hypothetical protein ABIR50_07770 [Ginsengibacter sp.]